MEEKTLEIGCDCKFTLCQYEHDALCNDVSLEYVEHSSDHWHSDMETDHTITKEKAMEIIEFLTEAFDIKEEDQ